jgi:branched-chain amino acid transport system substrate-binding protein
MSSKSFLSMNSSTARMSVLGFSSLILAFGAVVACGDDEASSSSGGGGGGDGGADVQASETGAETGPTCPPVAEPDLTARKCSQQLGEPAAVVKGQCVKLKSAECPIVVGPTDNNSALYFGAVQDIFGGQKAPGQAGLNALELAVKEINDKGGIRDPDRCKPARPLVFVGCNDSNVNPDGTAGAAAVAPDPPARQKAVAEHLWSELDLPLITGGTTSGTSLALNNYATPKYKKLFLTTRSTSPIFENPGTPGNAATFNASPDGTRLFWRATGNAKGQTAAMRLVLAQLAQAAKDKFTIGNVKVALVVKNDAFGLGTADAFETGLTVNGAAAGGSNVNANYKRYNIVERPAKDAGGADVPAPAGQIQQSDALADLQTIQPEVIIFINTDEFVAGTAGISDPRNTGILKPYEDWLRGAGAATRKPFYLHSHASISGAFTNYLNNFANFGSDAPTRKAFLERTRGTNLSEPTELANAFFNRYKNVFQTPTESIYGMPEAYDAGYIIAYLFAATHWKPEGVSALALAKAFPSLIEGASAIDNGPSAFNGAIQTLITGGKINYNGAVGPFDWNTTTGEAPYNANVWCIQVNPNTSTLFYQQNAAQIWRYQSGQLEGNFACPQQ